MVNQRYADRRRHWYDEWLDDRARYPLATIWGAVPLFESLDAIALAAPTRANKAAVTRFAKGAERYFDRDLAPHGGYAPYPGDRGPAEAWFDDNGWWGLAFFNAYRATGQRRFLADAQRALDYVAAAGWDPAAGGIWWDTNHDYKAGEPLAAATLLAALLYRQTHAAGDLAAAQRFLGWANGRGRDPSSGLFMRSDRDPRPVSYVQAPLIYAQQVLCTATGDRSLCTRARDLAATSLDRFGQTLDFGPQYDAIYLQWMLAYYGETHDPAWYGLAVANADRVVRNALDAQGLFSRAWDGGDMAAHGARPGMLRTHAATTSVLAWLAVYPPPA
jgi:uncharacterized protein YyaL (SSP411 family)